jgi:hypothetical protein
LRFSLFPPLAQTPSGLFFTGFFKIRSLDLSAAVFYVKKPPRPLKALAKSNFL